MKNREKRMYAGLLTALALVLAATYTNHFNDFTEISASHDQTLTLCFYGGFAAAALTGIFAFLVSRGVSAFRRVGLIAAFGFLGFLCTFMVSDSITTYVQGRTHFPPSRTKSFRGLMQISRAYQTHGKGTHWHIQTQPLWTDLSISEEDYKFMLAHRRPDDQPGDPDEIRSKGYFCAKVGAAIRHGHPDYARRQPSSSRREHSRVPCTDTPAAQLIQAVCPIHAQSAWSLP